MRRARRTVPVLVTLAIFAAACSRRDPSAAAGDAALGARIFNRTQDYTRDLGGNALACTNCHIDGGRTDGRLSLRGVAGSYPVGANGRSTGLEDRIVRCFTHSLAARAPAPQSPVVAALAAYVASLANTLAPDGRVRAAPSIAIAAKNLVPISELSADRGRLQYDGLCAGCHGLNGQGYRERRTPLPYDYVPPVWGPRSYDTAAGMARVYTLAAFARHAMPWDEPGTISDRDAQEIAAFVDGQPRPVFPDPSAWDGTHPTDAVYDTTLYPKNPFFVPLDQ